MAAVGPMSSPNSNSGGGNSPILNAARFAGLALIVLGSLYLLLLHRQWFEDPLSVKTEVTSWGIWGPVAYILLYAVGPSFLVPGAVMTIAGGLAFGALWGSAWSLIGANLGALIAFAAGRFLGRGFVERAMGDRFSGMIGRLKRNGFYVTLYLRIVPVIPYNAFNLLAGASPIRFSDYMWASIIGMVPGTILFALLGDALWHPMSSRFFVAVGMILCCFAAGETFRRWKASEIEV